MQLVFLSQNLFFSSSCSLEITSEIGFESFSFFTTKSCWKVFMPWLILLFKLLYDALMATCKSKDWKWILGREIHRNEFLWNLRCYKLFSLVKAIYFNSFSYNDYDFQNHLIANALNMISLFVLFYFWNKYITNIGS